MKIVKADIDSIIWALQLAASVEKQSLSEDFKTIARKHQRRLRKVYLMLMDATKQGNLNFREAIQAGLPDDSKVAKGIKALTEETSPEVSSVGAGSSLED